MLVKQQKLERAHARIVTQKTKTKNYNKTEVSTSKIRDKAKTGKKKNQLAWNKINHVMQGRMLTLHTIDLVQVPHVPNVNVAQSDRVFTGSASCNGRQVSFAARKNEIGIITASLRVTRYAISEATIRYFSRFDKLKAMNVNLKPNAGANNMFS